MSLATGAGAGGSSSLSSCMYDRGMDSERTHALALSVEVLTDESPVLEDAAELLNVEG
jgi:hypothetical protein